MIWAKHSADMVPFGTYSYPEGDGGSEGSMYTEWGFRESDTPIMAVLTTWPLKNPNERSSKYWLFMIKEPEE
jgi:hypothetical protein